MQKYSDVVLDKNGRGVAGLSITVKTYPDGLPATIYGADGGPAVASVSTDSAGRFSFYAANGHYSVTVSGTGIQPVDYNDIVLYDVKSDRFNTKDYGALGDSIADDKNAIQLAASAGAADSIAIHAGTFGMTGYVSANGASLRAAGKGAGATTLKTKISTSPALLALQNSNNSRIESMTLDVSSVNSAANGHPVSMVDVNDTLVRNVSVKGMAGTGSALLIYPALDTNFISRVRLQDIDTFGVPGSSVNTNGPLIVNGQFCQMRGLYSEGIVAYAIEYKNATSWSIGSDLIANNSCNGIGFGQTTADQTGVSYSAVSNFIAKDCANSVVMGKGGYNALSNGVMHIKTPYSGPGAGATNKTAIYLSGDTTGNSIANIVIAGDVLEAVRYGAQRNYVSLAGHNTSTLVRLDAGAQGNVTEITHPGTRTSILGAITDNSGNASLSGATANPVYSHATGEYIGVIGSRWLWRYAASGANPSLASQKWVYETTGDALPTILNDGTGTSGWLVQGPGGSRGFTYSWASDYWRVYMSTGAFRFYPTTFRAETDLASDLGGTAFRFKNLYAQNVVLTPAASVTPAGNGQMMFELTNDTTLKVKVKGSDGVVRSATLTLA